MDSSCPIHTLKYIIQKAHINKSYEDVFRYGAVVKMAIHWNCYLNDWTSLFFSASEVPKCRPTYNFTDFPNPEYNIWDRRNFVYKEITTGINERILVKKFGIRLIVVVSGVIKKYERFHFVMEWLRLNGNVSTAIAIFSFLVLKFKGWDFADVVWETTQSRYTVLQRNMQVKTAHVEQIELKETSGRGAEYEILA